MVVSISQWARLSNYWKAISIFIFFIIPSSLFGVDYYWVNGSGNWSDFANHWATSSGGSVFHNQVPSPNDNVHFDGNSFSAPNQQVTLDVDAFCANMTWSSTLGSLNPYFHTNNKITTVGVNLNINGVVRWIGNGNLHVDGDLIINPTTGPQSFDPNDVFLKGSMDIANITWQANFLYLDGAGNGNTIKTNGVKLYRLYLRGTGEWTLQDKLEVSYETFVHHGVFNSGGKRVDFGWRLYGIYSDADFHLDFTGSDTVEVDRRWRLHTGTASTIDMGSSVLYFNANVHDHFYFDGGNKPYHDVFVNWPTNNTGHTFYVRNNNTYNDFKAKFGSQQRIRFEGSNTTFNDVELEWIYNGTGNYYGDANFYNGKTINTLTLKNPAGVVRTLCYLYQNNSIGTFNIEPGFKEVYLEQNRTQSIGSINWQGGCTSVPLIASNSNGIANISMASGTSQVDQCKLRNLNGIGGASFVANSSVDLGGNSNWTFQNSSTTDLYWVGGSGNWSDPNHWATSSGGTPNGTCYPQANDNAIFDANSFSAAGQTVTVNLHAEVATMHWKSGVVGNPRINGSFNLTVNQDLKIDGDMIYNQTGWLYLYGSLILNPDVQWDHYNWTSFQAVDSNNVIDMAGHQMRSHVRFDGKGGLWTLADEFKTANGHETQFFNGTLKSNGHQIYFGWRLHGWVNGTAYNYHLDLTGTDSVFVDRRWEVYPSNSSKVTASNTVVSFDNNIADHNYFYGGVNTYGGLSSKMRHSSSSHTFYINYQDTILGKSTFEFWGNQRLSQSNQNALFGPVEFISTTTNTSYTPHVVFNARTMGDYNALSNIVTKSYLYYGTVKSIVIPAGHELYFASGQTKIITDSLIAIGQCDKPLSIQGNSSGNAATLSMVAGAKFQVDYAYLKDLNGVGGNAFVATNTADLGNVSGFNLGSFSINKLYWVGGSGDFSDAAHWSLSSGGSPQVCPPSLLDTVIFDHNSFPSTGGVVNIDQQNEQVGTMIWTSGVLGNPVLTGNQNLIINGSLLIDGAMQFNQNSNLTIRGSLRFNPNLVWNHSNNIYFYSDSTNNTLKFNGFENFLGHMYFNNPGNNNTSSPKWTFLDNMVHHIDYNFQVYRGNFDFLGNKYQFGYQLYAWTSGICNFDFNSTDTIIVRRGLEFYSNTSSTSVTQNKPLVIFKSPQYEDFRFRGNHKAWGNFDMDMDYPHHGWRQIWFLEYQSLGDVDVFMAQGSNTHRQLHFNGGSNLSDTYGNLNVEAGGAHTYVYTQSGRTWKNISMKSNGHLYSWRWFAYNLNADTIRIDGVRMEIPNGHTVNAKALIPANSCTNESEIYGSSTSSVLNIDTGFTVNANYIKLTNHAATGGAIFNAQNATVTGTVTGWNINPVPNYNLYWVGGSGDWDDVNHWSFTSGGSPTGCVIPQAKDNVIFDANSFSPGDNTVTFYTGNTKQCKNFIVNGTTENPNFNGNRTLQVYGDMVLNDACNYNHGGELHLFGSIKVDVSVNWAHHHWTRFYASSGNHEIDMNGVGFDYHTHFYGGPTATWTLQSPFDYSHRYGYTTHFQRGHLVVNGQFTHFSHQFYSNYNDVRSIDISGSTVNVEEWWRVGGANFSINSANSEIVIDDINNSHAYFYGGGHTYDDVTFISNNSGNNYQTQIHDNNEFGDVVFKPSAQRQIHINGNGKYNSFAIEVNNNNVSTTTNINVNGSNDFGSFTVLSPGTAGPYIYLNEDNSFGNFAGAGQATRLFIGSGKTQTVEDFTLLGTGGAPAFLQSTTAGSQGTLYKEDGLICMDFIWLKDINADGTATFNAGASSQDLGNNTGWNFQSCDGYYWVGGSGDWSDTTHWANSSGGTQKHLVPPSKFDNVYFDANSFSSANQVVNIDVVAPEVFDMDWLSAFYHPTFKMNGKAIDIHGSLTLTASMTIDSTFKWVFKGTTGEHKINAAGHDLQIAHFEGPGGISPAGTWNLTNRFDASNQMLIKRGFFNSDDFDLGLGALIIQSDANGGAIDWGESEITLKSSYSESDLSNLPIDADSAHIILSPDYYAGFTGKGLYSIKKVSIENNDGNYIIFGGPNKISTLNVGSGSNVAFTVGANSVDSIGTLNSLGTCSQVTSLSSYGTSAAFLVLNEANVAFNSIKNITAIGANSPFVAENSTDQGGNTGWSFTQAPVLEVEIIANNATCPNPNNGNAKAQVTGGKLPLEFEWSTLETTDSISGLVPGTYFVAVTDSNGCQASDTVVISAPSNFGFEIALQGDAVCNGENDGTISVTAVHADSIQYEYLWSTGDTLATVSGLGRGKYSVAVSDENGCVANGAIAVNEQDPFSINIESEIEACGGDSIQFTASAGGFTSALDFDGGDDYLEVPHDAVLNVPSGDFTLEAWIYPHSGGSRTIFSKGHGSGGTNPDVYIFQYQSNRLALYLGNTSSGGQWQYSNSTFSTNQWTHVAVSYDYSNGQATFYINGQADGTKTFTNAPTYAGDQNSLFIGKQGYGCNCNYFDGVIDEVRIWNKQKSATEIASEFQETLSGSESGLVAYFPFSENSGTTTRSIQALISDAVLTNMVPGDDWVAASNENYLGANYSYAWDFGDGNTGTGKEISNVYSDEGSYQVQVTGTDATGCEQTGAQSIEIYPELTATAVVNDVKCNGDCDGEVAFSFSGGKAPYQLSSPSEFEDDFTGSNLNTSAYVKDPYGTYSQQNNELVFSHGGGWNKYFFTQQNFSREPGKIFSFSYYHKGGHTMIGWYSPDNSNGNRYFNLPHSIYFAHNNLGVYEDGSHRIWFEGQIPGGYTKNTWYECEIELKASGAIYRVRKAGAANFVTYYTSNYSTESNLSVGLAIHDSPGNMTDNWKVSAGSNSQPTSGLCPGDYTYVVSDSLGCTVNVDFTISEPAALSLNISAKDTFCLGDSAMHFSSSASGGVTPYSYAWNFGDGGSSSASSPSHSYSNEGTYTVTLILTDSNNCIIQAQTNVVSYQCNQPPVAVCQNALLGTDSNCQAIVTYNDIDGGSYDPDGDNFTIQVLNPGPYPIGTHVVTLKVTDPSSETDQCQATVTIKDNVDPIAVCKDITIQLDANGAASIVAADVDGGSNDACGIQGLAIDKSQFGCSDVGANTVTLTVTDNNGNQSSCQATVTVVDSVAPVALCKDITIQLDANGAASIVAADVDGGSIDACGIQGLAIDKSQFGCSDVGANTVTLTVTDNNGNQSSCQATVTVVDSVPPVAVCKDITIQLDANGAASIVASDIDGGSNDACGIQGLAIDKSQFGCSDVGANTVTLTVTDNNGNQSSCQATVTVVDSVPPVAICQDITIQLDHLGLASIQPIDIDGGSNDACGIHGLAIDKSQFGCSDVGANTVTLTVTDNNGNQSSCQATVTVVDSVAPVALCKDITIQLDANGAASIVAADIDGGSNDACGIQGLAIDKSQFGCGDVGPNTVTLTVTDNNGNQSSCQATVTVVDSVAPVALCKDITIQLDANGAASIVAADIDGGSNDACGIQGLAIDKFQFGCSDVGSNTVTLTVTDNNGNQSSCQATVTVVDSVAPVAVCKDITIQLDANGAASIVAADVDGGSNDACGIQGLAIDKSQFGCSDVGANTVTLTVTDNNGNQSSCQATVTVVDSVAPVAVCKDITIQLDANGAASIVAADIDGGSNDACGIQGLAIDKSQFGCSDVGANTVTLTVTDNNGNQASCQATVTVVDSVPPVALCQDVTIQLDHLGLASIQPIDIDGGSNDACGIHGLAIDKSQFGCGDVGANTVTLTVTDNNGNQSSCQAKVTVVDSVPPVAICQDITIQLDHLGLASIQPIDIDGGSNDACGIQ
ncbi:LamG-like jellyroll fold domain-containing protein, partial [Luteibaculum oceani]